MPFSQEIFNTQDLQVASDRPNQGCTKHFKGTPPKKSREPLAISLFHTVCDAAAGVDMEDYAMQSKGKDVNVK
ncbi:MAG: hypothetical protein Q9205_006367 [Flavoplaca limonia]